MPLAFLGGVLQLLFHPMFRNRWQLACLPLWMNELLEGKDCVVCVCVCVCVRERERERERDVGET